MEILPFERYDEYEAFARAHPRGNIMQSVRWHGVKREWGHEIIVSRRGDGSIAGGASVLIRRMPVFGTAMLYAPRGPVCDPHDAAVVADLKQGIDALAKRHRAHLFKMDPDIPAGDEAFQTLMREMGFRVFLGGDGFETVQPRFNVRLSLEGKTEQEVLMGMKQKTRYNIRIAQKHGVDVRVMGEDALGDFVRLMRTTGDRDGFSVRPESYFRQMLDALGDWGRLYMAYYNGKAVSGAITSIYAGTACYLYGASDNGHRNVMPNYLIQWEMIRWALASGCTSYDFHGVSGSLDDNNPLYGLYKFKIGFGGVLEETAGEFDYLYMPVRAALVEKAIDLWEWSRKIMGK